MQLSTIEFRGYKRLVEAQCNVDGKVIAFVGPNESGKSSVLQGLQWLTGGVRPLRVQEQNRDDRPESEALVVRARYRIDDDDVEALERLDLDVEPAISRKTVTEFRVSRRVDGTLITGLTTTVERNTAIVAQTNAQIAKIIGHIEAAQSLPDDERTGPVENILRGAAGLLDPSDSTWSEDRINGLNAAQSSIDELFNNVSASRTLQTSTFSCATTSRL